MAQWNSLPYELVTRIVNNFGTDTKKNKWMFVNRQCHEICQSIAYEEVSIKLDTADKTLDTILHSSFQPGRWIRTVNFNSLTAPENFNDIDPTVDFLHLLMTRCPNVVSIEFPKTFISTRDWAYFSAVLMDNNTWKLRSLPRQYNKNDHFAYYFSCALFMKDSLITLDLTKNMVGRGNFHLLLGFGNLTSLFLGENILTDWFNCETILKYLNQLTTFSVEGFRRNNTMEVNLTDDEDSYLASTCSYNSIEDLILKRYGPLLDQDLLLIMKRFTGLSNLIISGSSRASWSPAAISSPVMKSFFEYIQTIPKTNITIGGLTGEIWLWDTYCASRNNVGKDSDIRSTVEFAGWEYSLSNGANFEFQICNDSSGSLVSLTFATNMDTEERKNRAKIALSHFSEISHAMTFNLADHDERIGDFINTIISIEHSNLRDLTIEGGKLESYSIQQEISSHQITRLALTASDLDKHALSLLSSNFPKLEYLRLQDCFYMMSENINIHMMDTAIGILDVLHSEIYEPMLLVSAFSGENENVISKYFITYATDCSSQEINETQFDTLKHGLNSEEFATVSIRAKSFRFISLCTDGRSPGSHSVKFSFP